MNKKIKIIIYTFIALISNIALIILVKENFSYSQKHIEDYSTFFFMLLALLLLFIALLRIVLILRNINKARLSLSLAAFLIIITLYWTMAIFDSAKCVACDGGKKAITLFWIHG